MLPFNTINIQYGNQHSPRSQCYRQPHPVCVFMAFVSPLYLRRWIKGVHDYKPSTHTMCSEGPRGEIHIGLLGGFLRTTSHREIFLLSCSCTTRIRKTTIQKHGTSPRRDKMTQCTTDRESIWPFGNFHCTHTALLYPRALVSHQPFLWRRPALSYIETDQLPKTYPVSSTPTSKGCNDQLWLISWRARVSEGDNESETNNRWHEQQKVYG